MVKKMANMHHISIVMVTFMLLLLDSLSAHDGFIAPFI